MGEVIDILGQLRKDSQKIDEASQELEGGIDRKTGEIVRGVRRDYDDAFDDALIDFEERYLAREQRLPALDIRTARVKKAVRTANPELSDSFYALEAYVNQLKRLISSRKAAVSANQSILKGEAA